MSWTNWPPAANQEFVEHAFAKQPFESVREKYYATGAPIFPPPTNVWLTGHVSSVVSGGSGSYTINSVEAITSGRWYSYSRPPGDTTTPIFYDLVIWDPFDFTKSVHLQITGNTASAFTVTDTPIADILTSKFLTSVSTWTGWRYAVIRRGGLFSIDRWIDYPNDEELYLGMGLVAGAILNVTSLTSSGTTATATVANHGYANGDSVTIAGATPSGYNGVKTITVTGANTFTYSLGSSLATPATGTITATNPNVGANDPTASMKPVAYASGCELVVEGSDGYLKRLTITGNDATNLFFSRNNFTVSGQYHIGPTGFKCRLFTNDNKPNAGFVLRWYDCSVTAGIDPFDLYYTRSPHDASIVTKHVPKQFIQLLGGLSCTPQTAELLLDEDLSTVENDTCNQPDTIINPNYPKTYHAVQKYLEDLSFFCVQKGISYEGASAIPTLTPADAFSLASEGNVLSTTTGSLDNTGGVGGIDLSSGFTAPFYPYTVYYTIKDSDGNPTTWGIGTLDRSTHLNKLYPLPSGSFASGDTGKTIIIADGWNRRPPYAYLYQYDKWFFVPDVVGGSVVDPPTSTNPGSYVFRPKSTKYIEVADNGIIDDGNSIIAFSDGDLALYLGDNCHDPSIKPAIKTTDGSVVTNYYAAAFDGAPTQGQEAAYLASLQVNITSSTRFSVTDSSKNWWPDGVLHTESGTFNSGSTTTGGDSTKSGSGFWGNGTPGSNNYLLNHIVQVTQGGVEYRRYIFAYTGTLTMTWSDALPGSANGDSYQIRMPKGVKNRWAERTLQLTFPDGTVHNVQIIGNDDTTLYFNNLGFDIPAGTTGQIVENLPGMYKWQASGSQWIIPTGTDPRNGMTILPNVTSNHPFTFHRHGRIHHLDYYFNEQADGIYNVAQQLMWFKHTGLNWISKGETNTNRPPSKNGDGISLADAQAQVSSDWNNGSYTSSTTGQPFSVAYTDYNCACWSYGTGGRYAYATLTINDYQAAQLDFYAKAWIPTNLDGVSSSTNLQNFGCPLETTFDDEGTGLILDKWHKWDTQSMAAGSGGVVTSAKLGSMPTQPNLIGPAPTPCPTSTICSWYAGFTVIDQCAIAHRNVANGLVYQ